MCIVRQFRGTQTLLTHKRHRCQIRRSPTCGPVLLVKSISQFLYYSLTLFLLCFLWLECSPGAVTLWDMMSAQTQGAPADLRTKAGSKSIGSRPPAAIMWKHLGRSSLLCTYSLCNHSQTEAPLCIGHY